MFAKSTIVVAATYFASFALADEVTSAPFNLTAISASGNAFVGGHLGACHVAAGTEQLCLLQTPDSGSVFQFNYTTGGPVLEGFDTPAGEVFYTETTDDNQPLTFVADQNNSNILYSLFGQPGFTPGIAFSSNNDQMAYIDSESTAHFDFWLCPHQLGPGFNNFPTLTYDEAGVAPFPECNATNVFRSF